MGKKRYTDGFAGNKEEDEEVIGMKGFLTDP